MTSTSTRSRGAVHMLRTSIGLFIRTVCTLCALLLAVGAVLISLRHTLVVGNPPVRWLVDAGDAIDGPFSRSNGVFAFTGTHAATLEALFNWGIAALLYLLVGRLLDRLIRP